MVEFDVELKQVLVSTVMVVELTRLQLRLGTNISKGDEILKVEFDVEVLFWESMFMSKTG